MEGQGRQTACQLSLEMGRDYRGPFCESGYLPVPVADEPGKTLKPSAIVEHPWSMC